MRKILILDDKMSRHNSYVARMEETWGDDYAGIHVETAKMAITIIRGLAGIEAFDFTFLDHDLHERDENRKCDGRGCGCEVARFIVSTPEIRKACGTVIVHSFSEVMGQPMSAILGCEWRPGLWAEQEWKRWLAERR